MNCFLAQHCEAQHLIAHHRLFMNVSNFPFFPLEIMAVKTEATVGNIFRGKEVKGAATIIFLCQSIHVRPQIPRDPFAEPPCVVSIFCAQMQIWKWWQKVQSLLPWSAAGDKRSDHSKSNTSQWNAILGVVLRSPHQIVTGAPHESNTMQMCMSDHTHLIRQGKVLSLDQSGSVTTAIVWFSAEKHWGTGSIGASSMEGSEESVLWLLLLHRLRQTC